MPFKIKEDYQKFFFLEFYQIFGVNFYIKLVLNTFGVLKTPPMMRIPTTTTTTQNKINFNTN